jgi:SRSO17 transposase
MLERTFAAGVVLEWVTGDSVYGTCRALRSWLEQQQQAYVLAVSGQETVWLGSQQHFIKELLPTIPANEWHRLSAGRGTKGLRWYDWYRLELNAPSRSGWSRWLLVRRSISDPSDMTPYLVFAPCASSLAKQVRAAGMRSPVEESIQTGKGEVGMDHYEVRSWAGWYRHITLAMWAQAVLTVLRAETGFEEGAKKRQLNRAALGSLAAFKAHRGLQSA